MNNYIWNDRLASMTRQPNENPKRKIVLFLDNASSHTHLDLANIKLISFHPNKLISFHPNKTSNSQPLGQGIIQNFKVKYCKFALQHFIADLDGAQNA